MSLYQIEIKENVANLLLNRPEVRNAFNAEMIRELTLALRELAKNNDLRVLVVRGAGESFCAGADLEWMKSMVGYSKEENIKDSQELYAMFEALTAIPFPVVGLVQGHAMGGGVGLVAALDICLAVEHTQFCFSEVRLGLAPAVISSFVLAKVPRSYLQRYFLTAELFNPAEAQAMGLVHQVVNRNESEKVLQTLVRKICNNGPQAVRATKKLLSQISPQNDVKQSTTELIADLRVGAEGQEGLRSFLEKRKPSWIGGTSV